MSQPMIRVWPDVGSEAEAGKLTAQLRDAVRAVAPDVTVTTARRDPHAQGGEEILLTAVSHVAVMALFEGLKFIWERTRERWSLQLPDGGQFTFHGDTEELKKFLARVEGG